MDIWRHLDRRELIRRGALLWPALHFGAVGAAGASGASENEPAARRQVGFLELALETDRLDEQRVFYGEVLGLDVAEEGDDLVVAAGQTRLRFTPVDDGSQFSYHFAFNIPQNKLDRAMDWLARRRVPLSPGRDGNVVFHFESWNAHAIYFFDPAGNIAEFIARHNLPNDAAGGFGTRDILYASEIGLATPDVPALAGELEERLGIDHYGGSSEQFSAMGDEHGLFIVVADGRQWLASDKSAGIHPTRVTMEGNRAAEIRLPDLPFELRLVT